MSTEPEENTTFAKGHQFKKLILAFLSIGIGLGIVLLTAFYGYGLLKIAQSRGLIKKGQYKEAQKVLVSADKWILQREKSQEVLEMAKKLQKSADLHEEALTLSKSGAKDKSWWLLKKIDPSYYRYKEVQKTMDELYQAIVIAKLQESLNLERDGDTWLALAKIADILSMDKTNAEALERKSVLLPKLLKEVNSMFFDQDYAFVGKYARVMLRVDPENAFAKNKIEELKHLAEVYEADVASYMKKIEPGMNRVKKALEKKVPLPEVLREAGIIRPMIRQNWHATYDLGRIWVGLGEEDNKYWELNTILGTAAGFLDTIKEYNKTKNRGDMDILNWEEGMMSDALPAEEHKNFYWLVKDSITVFRVNFGLPAYDI